MNISRRACFCGAITLAALPGVVIIALGGWYTLGATTETEWMLYPLAGGLALYLWAIVHLALLAERKQ